MKSIRIEYDWLRNVLPKGFPYPSSTLISGPGGTGKPLVEFAFVVSWLKSGGSAIAIPLQYPTTEFVRATMSRLYNVNLKKYHRRIAYIQFEPHIDEYKEVSDNTIKANLLNPEMWNKVIKIADNMVEKSNSRVLVFGSALNLLLFSSTYKKSIMKNLETIIKNDKNRTYIFSVSTNVFADEIKAWEDAADNLMYMRIEKPMRLFFKISKMKGTKFSREEVNVPISREVLSKIRKIAEATKKKIIPEIMKAS